MNLLKKFNDLLDKRLNARFQHLIDEGLYARDVVPVAIEGEKRERLALLCVSKSKVYAVVCMNTSTFSLFQLLGHNISATKGIVNKKWLVTLSGQYEGLQAPLIVAKSVIIRK